MSDPMPVNPQAPQLPAPSAMRKRELLPGVTPNVPPPPVVCDSRRVIRQARRAALARDLLQVALLAAVDYLFVHWSSTHVPLLDRRASFILLGIVNGAVVAHIWLARWMPRWTARRIAATWCSREREHLVKILPPL
jgi:hypothetical protein